jgi:hypothetical protein
MHGRALQWGQLWRGLQGPSDKLGKVSSEMAYSFERYLFRFLDAVEDKWLPSVEPVLHLRSCSSVQIVGEFCLGISPWKTSVLQAST